MTEQYRWREWRQWRPGASGVASKGGHGGKGDNPGRTTTGGDTTGSGSSHPPKNPLSSCVGKCVGTPGYYTVSGHHHLH